MPFVDAKCPNCGGALQVDNSKRAAVCPFCKETYIVENAINNYITNYNTNVEHLHADTVILNDGNSVESQIRAADALIKLGNYSAARDKYLDITNKHPDYYQGWWGLIRVCTEDFTKKPLQRDEYQTIQEYYHNAEMVCDDLSKIKGVFSTYTSQVRIAAHQRCQALETQIENEKRNLAVLKQRNIQPISQISMKIESLNESVNKLKGEKKNIKQHYYGDYKCWLIFAVVFEIAGIVNVSSSGHLFSGFVSALLALFGWVLGLLFGYLVEPLVLAIARKNAIAQANNNKKIEATIQNYYSEISELKAQKSRYERNTDLVEGKIYQLTAELEKYRYP